MALGLNEQAQMHQLEGGLSRYGHAGAQEARLRSLQQGGVLADAGVFAEMLLNLLAKPRHKIPVTRIDARAPRRWVGQESLQIREQRRKQAREREPSARCRAAELAQQHLAE